MTLTLSTSTGLYRPVAPSIPRFGSTISWINRLAPGIVRLKSPAPSAKEGGSGFLVRHNGQCYLLTNAHVADSFGTHAPIAVEGFDRHHLPAMLDMDLALAHCDRERDIAVFRVNRPSSQYPVLALRNLARQPLQTDEPLFILGRSPGRRAKSDGSWPLESGFLKFFNPVKEHAGKGYGDTGNQFELSTCIFQGDSGSPILDKNGEVTGMVHGGSFGYRIDPVMGVIRDTRSGSTVGIAASELLGVLQKCS